MTRGRLFLGAAPAGDRLTAATLRAMRAAVGARSVHPRIRRRLLDLWRGVGPLDRAEQVRRVWDHVVASVRYQSDPVGVEHITDPVTLDEQIDQGIAAEDCESLATYAATLLAAGGIPSDFELEAAAGRAWSHVALVVEMGRGQAPLHFDPVGLVRHQSFGLGDTLLPAGGRAQRIPAVDSSAVLGLGGPFMARSPFRGCLDDDDTGALGADPDYGQITRNAVDTGAAIAPIFGPWGAAAALGVKAGEGLYDAINPKAPASGASGGPKVRAGTNHPPPGFIASLKNAAASAIAVEPSRPKDSGGGSVLPVLGLVATGAALLL